MKGCVDMKVAELKKLCSDLGLKSTGKKAELVERLQAHSKGVDGRDVCTTWYYCCDVSNRIMRMN